MTVSPQVYEETERLLEIPDASPRDHDAVVRRKKLRARLSAAIVAGVLALAAVLCYTSFAARGFGSPPSRPTAVIDLEGTKPRPAPKVGVAVIDPSVSTTLFCFAMVMEHGVEQWLMTEQWHRGTGIFGCHKFSLLSDGKLSLKSWSQASLQAVALPGDKAWFAPVDNTPDGVWHNTNVFVRAWKWVAKQGEYLDYDWTVKVDPDCVFLPGTLQSVLHGKGLDVASPIFLLNCAQWGVIQGPLEIFSKSASQKFFDGLDDCLAWTEWKAWGEDWFVNKCMQIVGAQAQDGFELMDDMWCKVDWGGSGHTYADEVQANGPACGDGKAAWHPYKTTKDMKQCLDQALPG